MDQDIIAQQEAMLPLSSPSSNGTSGRATVIDAEAKKLEEAITRAKRKSFNLWFGTLIGITCFFGILYIILHHYKTEKVVDRHTVPIGYEYAKLDATQQAHIAIIYLDGENNVAINADTGIGSNRGRAGENRIVTNRQTSITAVPLSSDPHTNTGDDQGLGPNSLTAKSATAYKADRVISYLDNYYNNNLDTAQSSRIKNYLSQCNDQEAISFLHAQRLMVRSYFWLTGPEVYYEIMFWALFGVLCSVLYMLSDVHRKRAEYADTDSPTEGFNTDEIPYQIAKMLYAPVTMLIIILGYNFIKGDNVQDISTSKGMLVLSFLGGFFSGRMMAFLNRLKDALLPADAGKPDHASAANTIPQPPAGSSPADQIILLEIDPSIDPAILETLTAKGFAGAIVTMENEAGQVISAKPKSGEDPLFSYIATGILPGAYIVTAEWEGEVIVGRSDNAEDMQPIVLVAREAELVDGSGKALRVTMTLSSH